MVYRLELEGDGTNIKEVEVTRQEVRDYFDADGHMPEGIDDALDQAQGDAKNDGVQYVIIKVTP